MIVVVNDANISRKSNYTSFEQKKFIVQAGGFSEQTIYNDIRYYNGNRIANPFVTYQEILSGGNLTFEMTIK